MNRYEKVIEPKCMDMCPKTECQKRQQQKMIHVLETDLPQATSRRELSANPEKMIKIYCRPAAGQNLCLPELLRPPPVLMKTVNYILKNIILDKRVNESAVYDFINDRFRSVKQDGIIQRMSVENWFQILSPIVRFYAFSAYWLCEESLKSFDQKLNRNQLLDCLLILTKNYEQNPTPKYATAYAEMEALYLIVDCNPETINRAVMLNLPEAVFQDTMKLVIKWFTGNYRAVFRDLIELPLLLSCLFCAMHLTMLRKNVLRIMSFAYCSKNANYPSSKLALDLLFNSVEDVNSELMFYGIAVSPKNGIIHFKKIGFPDNYVSQEQDFSTKNYNNKSPKSLDAVVLKELFYNVVVVSNALKLIKKQTHRGTIPFQNFTLFRSISQHYFIRVLLFLR